MTVEQIDERLARWGTKLKRAVNTIERLQKQRKRLGKKAAPTMAKAETIAEPVLRKIAGMPKPEGAALVTPDPVKAVPDLAIPAFLKRDTAADDAAAAAIKEEQADTKRRKARGRIDKMKAKQRGDLKKMPLSGRAALEAIRNG
jgi:hypothetical protein